MINKIIFATLLMLSPLAVLAQTDSGSAYVIQGNITGAEGKQLYLVNSQTEQPEDSATIKNGSFAIKGEVSDPSLYAMFLQDNQQPLIIWLEAGKTTINTEASKFPIAKITGNKQTAALEEYQEAFSVFSKEAAQLNKEASGLNQSDTTAVANFRAKAEAFNGKVEDKAKEFIKSHPSAIASVLALMNQLRSSLSAQELAGLFDSLNKEVQHSQIGTAAEAYITQLRATAIGVKAPDFTLDNVSGNPVNLSDFRGKYVLLDFWASWCGPCRQENPNVVAAYHRFKDRNFTILGVSLDNDKAKWQTAIQQDGLEWTQVSDLNGWSNKVAQEYKVYSIPQNLLINPDGVIIAKNLRGENLDKKLSEVLANK